MKQQPMYLQIKSHLMKLIYENEGNDNYMLPSESQLCLKFNASRMPVRKALCDLEKDGYIIKKQGKGSFIGSDLPALSDADDDRRRRIALILPDVTTNLPKNIILGVKSCCDTTHNDYILLCSFSSQQVEQQNIQLAKQLRCDGILLMPVDIDTYNDALLGLVVDKIPCIFIDRKLIGLQIPSVSSDHMLMGYSAAKILLSGGARHIAYFANTDAITSVNERAQGYSKALLEYGNPNSYIVNITDIKPDILPEKLEYFFRQTPQLDSVIVNSGLPAANVIRAFAVLGKTVGKDYKMVVFDDDNSLIDICMNINSTAIVQDGHQIGFTACRLLLGSIINGQIPPQKTFIPLLTHLPTDKIGSKIPSESGAK